MGSVKHMRSMSAANAGSLPPHLKEVCAILGRGLVRLRCRNSTEYAGTAKDSPDTGDNSLHFHPAQSGHASPRKRRTA